MIFENCFDSLIDAAGSNPLEAAFVPPMKTHPVAARPVITGAVAATMFRASFIDRDGLTPLEKIAVQLILQHHRDQARRNIF
jgi:hypothetical protein